MRVIGIDVGGAHLKFSDGGDYSRHIPFALWQHPDQLTHQLKSALNDAPAHERVIVTMTGELTDCFANKRDGVQFIVDACQGASNREFVFYLVDGTLVSGRQAKRRYIEAAASNWHALARQASIELARGRCGLLIDVGSTTTDIIPFRAGELLNRGQDDFGRLVHRELVYTGVVRSPLCGILPTIVHRGSECPVMNEVFATTIDVYVTLGHLPETIETPYTADGQPVDKFACRRRLARMIGRDDLSFDDCDAWELAQQYLDEQTRRIAQAVTHVVEREQMNRPRLVLSGQGEFLGAAAVNQISTESPDPWADSVRLSEQWGTATSACATAWSVARLARRIPTGRDDCTTAIP